MKKPRAEEWVRLGLGAGLNIVLWQVAHIGSEWGNAERQLRDMQLSAFIAAVALVTVIPLFWRGQPWQAPLAFVLVPLPVVAMFMAATFAIRYL